MADLDYDENPEAARKQAALNKAARRMIREDLLTLERDPAFMRWTGRLIQRCGLTDDLHTTNGGDIQRFMGRRSIAVEVLAEIEQLQPGFYERVMKARRNFEQELKLPTKESDDE